MSEGKTQRHNLLFIFQPPHFVRISTALPMSSVPWRPTVTPSVTVEALIHESATSERAVNTVQLPITL